MTDRPQRIRILDQFERPQSLDGGMDQFQHLPGTHGLLLLGLGPKPATLAQAVGNVPADYLESPDFVRQMPASWQHQIPGHWRRLSIDDLHDVPPPQCTSLLYRPNLRLFPDFWAPVLAARRLAQFPCANKSAKRSVWLPSSERGLLTRELDLALHKAGLATRFLPTSIEPPDLIHALREERPDLFLCVNFQGLDAYGQSFAILERLGIPVAVWCVDNPFHLLPRLKSEFWKRCLLFVTDDWFLRPLLEHGARCVHHLPLAASPELFQAKGAFNAPELAERIVFVGRSAFAGKNAFFAGCRVSGSDMEAAMTLLAKGRRPDFSWWRERLGPERLWPGKNVRDIGFAAEQCSWQWRMAGLLAAAECAPLTVFGDQGWLKLRANGQVSVREEVDYYGPLADIYCQARYTLNLTSLLLPHGLTQRHFDVWSVGGFLLTDQTPGLRLFDPELAAETAFNRAVDLSSLIRRLENDPALVAHLRTAWQKHVLDRHTYDQRVATVLEIVASGQGKM